MWTKPGRGGGLAGKWRQRLRLQNHRHPVRLSRTTPVRSPAPRRAWFSTCSPCPLMVSDNQLSWFLPAFKTKMKKCTQSKQITKEKQNRNGQSPACKGVGTVSSSFSVTDVRESVYVFTGWECEMFFSVWVRVTFIKTPIPQPPASTWPRFLSFLSLASTPNQSPRIDLKPPSLHALLKSSAHLSLESTLIAYVLHSFIQAFECWQNDPLLQAVLTKLATCSWSAPVSCATLHMLGDFSELCFSHLWGGGGNGPNLWACCALYSYTVGVHLWSLLQ